VPRLALPPLSEICTSDIAVPQPGHRGSGEPFLLLLRGLGTTGDGSPPAPRFDHRYRGGRLQDVMGDRRSELTVAPGCATVAWG
jgi:hypothetical protein